MIDVKGLTKRFGTVTALDNISFQVDSGSIFGLVGSNGAGKSTFLRTAAGIYRPDAGSVLIDGGEPFENLSVKENVCFISDYPFFPPNRHASRYGRSLLPHLPALGQGALFLLVLLLPAGYQAADPQHVQGHAASGGHSLCARRKAHAFAALTRFLTASTRSCASCSSEFSPARSPIAA